MVDQQASRAARPDPAHLARSLADIAERSQRLMSEWMTRNGLAAPRAVLADSLQMAGSFADFTTHMITDPAQLAQAQVSLWQSYMDLWQNTAARMLGLQSQAVYQPDPDDWRFRHPHWRENEIFNYIKQSYLLVSRWLEKTVHNIDGLDPRTRQRVEFYTRQFINAVSPSNFAFTNPEVIEATIASGGENLIDGLRNLLADLEKGSSGVQADGDFGPFAVGKTLATTPGKVIFRNEIMELIFYSPGSDTVFKEPLLFIPPWSNKYYIMDLNDRKSLVRWVVDHGYSVFVISWVNPSAERPDKNFEDYVLDGPVTALDVIVQVTGERAVHAVGYCLGGTLLAATMAYLADRGDRRIKSASFFAAMLDFREPGDLGTFVDEAAIACFEERRHNYTWRVDDLVSTVNFLRQNDLIWSFVVNTYLLGRDPLPLELLYWNFDANRLSAAMHGFYLNHIYRQNKLVEKGGIVVRDIPINLASITAPVYFLAAREDHIAPWRSIYKGMRLLSGPVRFTLAGSGHIAGVINPPGEDNQAHWASDQTPPAHPESWLSQATQRPGSWWLDWHAWLRRQGSSQRVQASTAMVYNRSSLCDAPGTYALAGARDTFL